MKKIKSRKEKMWVMFVGKDNYWNLFRTRREATAGGLYQGLKQLGGIPKIYRCEVQITLIKNQPL